MINVDLAFAVGRSHEVHALQLGRIFVSQVGYRQGNPRLQTQIIGRQPHFNTVSSHFGLRGHGSGWPWNNLVGRRSHARLPMHAPLTMSRDAAE
jgi:hypothetical protein